MKPQVVGVGIKCFIHCRRHGHWLVSRLRQQGRFNTMTLSLARALAPAIRVNAICPGFIGTRWFKDYMGEKYSDLKTQFGMQHPCDSQARRMIWGAGFFFLTDSAAHITGETLMVDAGTHLGFAAPLTAR